MKYQLMATAAAVMLALPANARDIEMQSIYPGTLPLLGSSGAELGDRVSMLTGGELNFVFRNPGEIVALPAEAGGGAAAALVEGAL